MKKLVIIFCFLITSGCQRETDTSTNSRIPTEKTDTHIDIMPKERKMKEVKSGTWTPGLSEDEADVVFSIARDTLKWCVENKAKPFSTDDYAITPKLKKHTATFVTLHIGPNLRGCIGSLEPEEPLYLSVHHNAVNAAMHDPRFRPVQPSELALIDISVSLLSPIRPIDTIEEFRLGEQGIILQKGMRRAVFLPEVAPEQGWTKEETLSHLSMKAGLSPDAWENNAHFQVFESVVLSLDEDEK